MWRHVAVENLAPFLLDDKETVQHAERHGGHGEEIAAGEHLAVILQKGRPLLRGIATAHDASQRVEPATKRQVGEPQPVQYFHDTRLSLKNITSTWCNLSVGRDKIVYELGERTGRIWMTR